MESVHLFAGVGGGMLADAVTGHKPIAVVEIEDDNCQLLERRFGPLHLHGDIRIFNDGAYEKYFNVDLVAGGFPCQSISSAGKQDGFAIDSGTKSSLGWEMLRAVNGIRPKQVFIENVANILSKRHRAQLDLMLGELGHMGYGGSFMILSSADVGGRHLRKRFWLLAEKGLKGWEHRAYPAAKSQHKKVYKLFATPRVGGRGTFHFVRKDGKIRDDLETQIFMHTCERELGKPARLVTPDEARQVLGKRKLNADWVEWLMNFPVGHTDPFVDNPSTCEEPSLCGIPMLKVHDNPGLNNRRLEQLGNAQDPVVASTAFHYLNARNHGRLH